MDSITQCLEQLSLEHNRDISQPAQTTSQITDGTDTDSLITQFQTQFRLVSTPSETTPSPSSSQSPSAFSASLSTTPNPEADPAHTFATLVHYASQYRSACIAAHAIAVELRSYFSKHPDLPYHHDVSAEIATSMCLRRIDAVAIGYAAEEQCDKSGPYAETASSRKKLARLYERVEEGYGGLDSVELGLRVLYSVVRAKENEWLGDELEDVLRELVKIRDGGRGERCFWLEDWPVGCGY